MLVHQQVSRESKGTDLGWGETCKSCQGACTPQPRPQHIVGPQKTLAETCGGFCGGGPRGTAEAGGGREACLGLMSALRLKVGHLRGAKRQFLGDSGSVPDPWDPPSALLLRLPLCSLPHSPPGSQHTRCTVWRGRSQVKISMGKGLEGERGASLEARRGGDFPSILPLRAALASFPDELPYLRCLRCTVLQLTPMACGECPDLVHEKAGTY